MFYSHKLFGQEQAVTFLSKALAKGHLAHSYLFSGQEGVGKKLLARQFAQSLNCTDKNVFNECACASCKKIASDMHADVKWLGADEAARSIKIEEVRTLQSWIMYRPFEGKKKVFIINRAERLTEEAANAFLKTLEEPPRDTHIILLVEHIFRLPDTILSRLTEVHLYPLPFEKLCEILRHEFGITEGVQYLAYQARGSLGLALKYHEENYFTLKNKIIDTYLTQQPTQYFFSLMNLSGADLDTLLHILSGFIHDVLLLQAQVDNSLLIHQDRIEDALMLHKKMRREDIIRLLSLLEEARLALKQNVNTKLLLSRLAAQGEAMVI